MNTKSNKNIYYMEANENMIILRDLVGGQVDQFNGSVTKIAKINKWVNENWSGDLTAKNVLDFAFSIKNVRHYSRAY